MSNEYRDAARQVARNTRWTVFRFLGVFVLCVGILAALGFGLRLTGVVGQRVIFEESIQRSSAINSAIASDRAVLAEIESRLASGDLDPETRANLLAQAAAARVRIQLLVSN